MSGFRLLKNSRSTGISRLVVLLYLAFFFGCGESKESTSSLPGQQDVSVDLDWNDRLERIRSGKSHSLIVVQQEVTPEQFHELLPLADKLQRLEIVSADLDDEDLSLLSECSHLQRLRLEFPVGDRTLEAISECENLRILNLPQGRFTDEGLGHLADLEHLELFRFGSPHVTNESMATLANLPGLRFLHLIDCPITDEGLLPFHDKPRLESFYVDGTDVTAQGLQALLDSNPDLHLHRDQLHLPSDPRGDDHH